MGMPGPEDPTADGGEPRTEPLDGADEVPDFRAARRHVLIELLRFTAQLRSEGVDVPTSGSLDAARSLAVMGLNDRRRVEDALRATLLSATADETVFESAFDTFWHRLRSGLSAVGADHDGPTAGDADEDSPDGPDTATPADDPGVLEDASPPELDGSDGGDVDVRIPTERRHVTGDRPAETGDDDARRFSAVGSRQRIDAETAQLGRTEIDAINRFVDALSTVPGRRRRRSETGDRIAARRALRSSLATGGAPIELPDTGPVPSELRCCLLVDVSGSVLDTIDRSVLLAFAERLHAGARRASVFLFDTDLVEATPQFERANGDPAAALREAEVEWGGGTQIGTAFETLRRQHPHALDRRTVVVVVSDGLDVGDPDTLADGITWLAGRAGTLVWLNPLAVSPEFEPRSRGMSTVEPYLDALFGFAEPADLAEAARQIEQRGLGRRVGYEFDARLSGGRAGGTE
ncbi:hypothetical protein SAMN04487946_10827 [Halobellus clavatus]|uniref:VWFA domain-containing protein n=2 Tax=Halobellus clavatus TaxID=660517 RepID=A0A1H3HSA2_9EURY|nr:hypothetical protein SAMN04487946_10827 [Halobellus clavatus]